MAELETAFVVVVFSLLAGVFFVLADQVIRVAVTFVFGISS